MVGALCKLLTVAFAIVVTASVRDMGLCDDDWDDDNDGYYLSYYYANQRGDVNVTGTWVEYDDDYCWIDYNQIEVTFICYAVGEGG